MRVNKLLITACFGLVLQNCAPVVVAGGSALAGESAFQERTLGTQIDDVSIWGKVKAALVAKNKGYSDINIKVNEGRVLLIGEVESPEDRLEILKLVWRQQGVSEVINEIKIAENNPTISGVATDSWITAQLKSKLLFAQDVQSMNYNIETIDRVVYLIGIAQNQNELDIVTKIASKIKHVEKVVSYVRLRNSKIRKEKHKI